MQMLIKLGGEKDVTMTEGDMPDLLAGITVDEGTVVDYSIMMNQCSQMLVEIHMYHYYVQVKMIKKPLKSLKPGTYNLYYTVYEKEIQQRQEQKRSFTYS